MTDQNPFKVVKIISPYQVVINAGSEAALRKGQRLLVYDIGEMIRDPETGEELEHIEIVRGTGRIIHLQGRIATVESDMKEEEPITIKRTSNLGSMRSLFGDTEQTEIRRSRIPFDEPQVGDRVRLYNE